MAGPYRMRLATPADAGRLAALEQTCFQDPWSQEGLLEVLAAPQAVGLVAEARSEIIAYGLMRWVQDTAEILNLAVHPEHRRRGLAGKLLEDLVGRARDRGATEVFLEVRESNTAARALYQGRGFRVAGMRRAYYRHPIEDALVLRLGLGTLA